MGQRGRPTISEIRQNIIEILYFLQKGYGYSIYSTYKKIFPSCTLKSIYYHLKKGVALEEISVEEVKDEKGDYSWGDSVRKTYYKLGPKAKPAMNPKVQDFFEQKFQR
jgi:hypothetical protein